MSSSKRIIKYDILRIVACLNIVLLHVSSSYLTVVPVSGGDFAIMAVYDSLTRFAVPVFMMLSGMFLIPSDCDNIYKDSGRRILRLLVIFYLWSAFYAFQSLILNLLRGTFAREMVASALRRFAYGHFHMWFLFLVLEFYLLRPIIKKICSDERTMEYFLGLWIGIRFVLPLLRELPVFEWIYLFISQMNLFMITGYMGYFILGYYLYRKEISPKIRYGIYSAGFISLVYTIVKTIAESRLNDVYTGAYANPGSLNILLYSIAVFCVFRYSEIKLRGNPKIISKLSRLTLTIYLVHPFFIEKFNLVGITTISFNPLFSIPLIWTVVAICSILSACLIDLVLNAFRK